jgi:pimeloyl-ACP methyl ester carboxylesterase
MADTDRVVLPDGRTVQLWSGGAPTGTPVLFFHGCPDTRHAAMTGDAAARGAGVRLVAANRPGYGASTACASDQLSVADDTLAVADLLGIDRFAVLGMSIGGPFALACAARHPDRVRAAAVVAAPSEEESLRRWAGGTLADAVEGARPEFEAFVARVAPGDTDDAALASRWRAALPAEDAALLPLSDTAVASSVREALALPDGFLRDAAVTFRPWAFRVDDVGCPTTLWYGERDDNAPPANGEELLARIPFATLRLRPTTHLATLLSGWAEVLEALVG